MSALNGKWLRWMVVAGGAAATLFAPALVAEDGQPDRGVARISLMQGDVSVRRGGSGEWVAAAPNAPLVVEDRVLTGLNSKAEVQLDHANFLRLAGNSEARLSELEYGRYQVQVASGTVTARVLRNSEAEVEISTANVSVRPIKKGMYRITVREDGATEVTVRSGEADIYTPRGTERLKSGRTMMVRGTSTDPEFQVESAIPRDGWDEWNDRRDEQLERSNSYRYVSTSVYGAEDLDNHGQWVSDPSYGNVWVPTVSAGWSPYRHGRWSWVDWYGWSWVSYDPWGWAPYHYGRWYMGSRGWCWWPGAMRSRHYWSPGLVAWVGFGGGGVGIGFGGGWGRVGWIPLAPHEPYYRWYGRDYYRGYGNRNYVNNSVNIVNNVNITNVYRNARVSNGVTAVDTGDFRNGRYTAARLSDSDFRNASLTRGQVPLTPERAHLRLADRDSAVQARGGSENSRFFSRRSPSPVERVSFDDQRRGVEDVRRRAFGEQAASRGGEVRGGGQTPGSGEARRTVEARTNEDAGRGWRRAGDSRSTTGSQESPAARGGDLTPRGDRTSGRSSDGGWRRFGEPRDAARSSEGGSPRSSEGRSSDAVRSNDTGSGRDRGNWRRFGDPASDSARPATVDSSRDSGRGRGWRNDDSPVTAPASPNRNSGSGSWRGFENPRQDSPRGESPRVESPRQNDAPAVDRSSSRDRERSNWRTFDSGNRGDSNTMNPPIIRERGSSRSSDSGMSNRSRFEGGGGYDRPARTESQQAPRMESRSPRSEGGGGGFSGGGGRSSGGGGMRMESGGGSSRGGGGGFSGGGRSSGGDGGGGGSRGGGGGRNR